MFPPQNKSVWKLASMLLAVAIPAVADIAEYSACQAPTPNPRDGCPENTLVVSSIPGDNSANFSTIQGHDWSVRLPPEVRAEGDHIYDWLLRSDFTNNRIEHTG
jgi:hypothetical protein